jgi:7-cyano-7-deazaguanine synthase in queuosine biosynthesis
MGQRPIPPESLRVAVHAAGGTVRWEYRTDRSDHGQIEITYPFDLDSVGRSLLPAISLGVATYLGQLCLAPNIELSFPVSLRMVELVEPLAQMLYDIRRWKDGLDAGDAPHYQGGSGDADLSPLHADLTPDRSVLLWSGGKDSTLSALVLQRNLYDVVPLHITANAGVEDRERRAVTSLADALGLSLLTAEYRHPEFLEFSTRYAVEWNRFPYCNTVPFGRDLLLALLAIPVARQLAAGKLSMGHDQELRKAYVEYQARRIPRNDVESVEGALALERYVRELLLPDLRFLPPLARMTEFRILCEMLGNHPDLMAQTAFCFWGDNCGRCAKCLRYYLAQRLVGGPEVLSFQVNPLATGASPELDDLLGEWGRPGLLFQKAVVYCMGRLVERGDVRTGEERLQDFANQAFPATQPYLDEWERDLMTMADDPQVPRDFHPEPKA